MVLERSDQDTLSLARHRPVSLLVRMVGYRGKEIAQRFELPGTGLGLVIPARLAFINLQTTGANPVRDRITRIGVLEAEGDRVSTWSTLVNPQRPIPALIQRLNGIRNEAIADAPTFAQVAAELADRLHGRPFVAHHARFNYGFVKVTTQGDHAEAQARRG
ncbi:3'-5' exonuclease [Candidatus Accumulibacter contiguus]|jgi:DNA polymerase III epsilon subunit-like protein|uniref:3'-5' exonuclease n=1 Tax=Candidatus Accumulibacter contiguus TaxID=2954381 RepID=UPI0035621B09